MTQDIHQGQPVHHFGTDDQAAQRIVIMLHGRGATAESLLPLTDALHAEGISFWLPQAALNRWYPNSAFGPLESNEPDLSSALAFVERLVHDARAQGFSNEQIVFGGFSQGACLASEFVARNAGNYGGLFVFSGALIGPRGMEREYSGSFDNMPVFIGGSDVDPWVAHDLMDSTAKVFKKMGALVDFQTYAGMAHTVNQDEIDRVRKMLTK